MADPLQVDCAIIGGGPAGLVAAIYLLRFRRSVLISDAGEARTLMISRSHNYPGFPDGISGADLLDRLRQQLLRYGKPTTTGPAIEVRPDAAGWSVLTAQGSTRARRLLLATGVRDLWPEIENSAEALRHGCLRFCPICDGFEIPAGSRVAVIGNDDHAVREAMFIRSFGADVTLLPLHDDELPETTRALVDRCELQLVVARRGSLLFDGECVRGETNDGRCIGPFPIVYAALGAVPRTELLTPLRPRASALGCLEVDEHQQTSIRGIYAAGDVVRGLSQISVAVGEAAIAATAIHNELRDEDSAHAAIGSPEARLDPEVRENPRSSRVGN